MSSIAVSSNPTGTGVFTITSPATNTNRTLTLPDDSGTLVHSGNTLFNATVAITAAYTVVAADRGKLFDCSGTFTVTLTAAATLGAGFSFAVRNSGTGVITLDPDAAELVDGVATIASSAGDAYAVTCNGTAFKTVGRRVGKILQVVHLDTGAVATGTTTIPADDTIPQQTEGDQYMSLTITPTAATSNLRIDVTAACASSAIQNFLVALFRDAGADATGAAYLIVPSANYYNTATFSVLVPASSITATTFKVRAGGASAGTTTFNGQGGARLYGGKLSSSIRITEIAA